MLCAAAAMAGLGACQPPTPAKPVAETVRPRPTIVSLNPCSDAVLAEIAAPEQLLAISHFSRDPSATSMDLKDAQRFATTSGTVEEIARLSPDVVVADVYIAPTTSAALQKLGIKVVTLPIAANVAQAEEQVRMLAQVARTPEQGEALVGRIEQALSRSRPAAGTAPVPALIWESGGIVAGGDTLIVDLMKHAGFANAAAARGLSQAAYLPLERVVADPPRVIFTVGNAASEEDRSLRHPVLAQLGDVSRARLDGSLVWCGGPTIPRALDRLAEVHAKLGQTQ